MSRQQTSFNRFAPLLRKGRRQLPEDAVLPATLEQTLLGAVCGVVSARLHRGEASSLPSLGPELTEFLLAPYLSSGCEGA